MCPITLFCTRSDHRGVSFTSLAALADAAMAVAIDRHCERSGSLCHPSTTRFADREGDPHSPLMEASATSF